MATHGLDFALLDRLAAAIAARPALVVAPGLPQPERAGPHPWIAAMIDAGELAWLDRMHLQPGEVERAPKAPPRSTKPAWLRAKAKKPRPAKLTLV